LASAAKHTQQTDGETRPSNFLSELIEADLAAGRHTKLVTRFPPEPNGWLHIGHAKAICVNFGLAKTFGGDCHLRFDDTNPATEDVSYVEAIQRDVKWLGWEWAGPVRYASDYFDFLFEYATGLIEAGKAYVDSSSLEEIREGRGTVYELGKPSKDRERSVEESLDLFRRMKAGEFEDGAYVLRARIDMTSPNMLLRDPLLYRIRHAHHYRTGDDWCIYPMYDFAHCLEDAYEGVTHSLCTLEFDNNRALYDWVLEEGDPPHRPRQTEFARLAVGYTVMSKRKLLKLVEGGYVSGWDDPRMPTLAGLRRRGVTAEAIRSFCDQVGVAKSNTVVDLNLLDHCIRADLNARAPRVMAVLDPIKLTVTDWPEGKVDVLDAPSWPDDVGLPGSRPVPFSGELLVERGDFAEDPPKGWYRLAPGREVRLRYGYLVTVQAVVKDEAGQVVELRCTHDPDSRGGNAPDGRKVPGTIHWVSAAHALPAEVRLYDRLFATEMPGANEEVDFLEELNPHSLELASGARVEPSLADAEPGTRVQFERVGFFAADDDSTAGALVFNRVVGLRDSWAKKAPATSGDGATGGTARKPERTQAGTAPTKAASHARDEIRASDPELTARHGRYRDELSLPDAEADVLSGDRELSDFFEAALAGHDDGAVVSRWVVNELLRHLEHRAPSELPFEPQAFGTLVGRVDDGTLSATGGKRLLAALVEGGGDPDALIESLGLRQVSDAGALEAQIAEVVAAHPDELARYRGGETKLMGFFMGQFMRASGGKADPKLAGKLLRDALAG
jgi:glutaminyl-tRNA synthetase